MLVDGRPFFFFGGAFFYERIAPARWRASMEAMRALGANTLDLYVPWNWHEVADGDFDFDGHTDPRRNLREVLRLGDELGFHFIVRPGPVIRNEWRNGGYPAWLLTRPEYRMPLHDVLEGRYPATATLQNARSDDAAAEWMQNATHLRYAGRWIHRALAELRPYAGRVLAVQLDDDQGAYMDNQTFPAPHLQRYLAWLNSQVRDAVGPNTPTFVNTYQMRIPLSAPVWTMGNWYQSDAYTVGNHDRVDLDFSTLLLATNRRGPPAQSEFQAGWLAGPEDPVPRPADPQNTDVALTELLALGVQGVVDFPLQDTLAEPGWEAPFSNAFYGWDAALGFAPVPEALPPQASFASFPPRLYPTAGFGGVVRALGPVLAEAQRSADLAIAYAEPPARPDSRPPDGAAAIVRAVRAALAACIAHGLTCDLADTAVEPNRLRRYRVLVVSPELTAFAPRAAARFRLNAARAAVRVNATVPPWHGSGVTTLRGPLGTIRIATNWTDSPIAVSYAGARDWVAPHSAGIRVEDLALAALGSAGDRRRISSNCFLRGVAPSADAGIGLTLSNPGSGCTIFVRSGRERQTLAVNENEYVTLPALESKTSQYDVDYVSVGLRAALTNLTPSAWLPFSAGPRLTAERATAEAAVALDDLGAHVYVLRNDRLRIVVDPAAGARAFSMQARDTLAAPGHPRAREGDRDGWSQNAFDATGSWRDDVAAPLGRSPRDYIARFTHGYPAGTFNRSYAASLVSSGPRAELRFSYTMPDVEPAGTTFERVVTLDAASSRVVVDERIVAPPGARKTQRLVVRSSLPLLRDVVPTPPSLMPRMEPPALPHAILDAPYCRTSCTLDAAHPSAGAFRDGFAFVVAWRQGDVMSASWSPYRSTGTLALTMTPGVWHRIVYAYAAVASLREARAFAEAERAWVSANPVTAR